MLERASLTAAIGKDFSSPALVMVMVRGEREWKVVSSFCEAVTLWKEETKKERERERAG